MISVILGGFIFILIIVFIIFAVILFRKANKIGYAQVLIPFRGELNPSSPSSEVKLQTTNQQGEILNQITCPVGTHINILNARFEVNDLFGECTDSPNNLFSAACGRDSTNVKCKVNSDCPASQGSVCQEGYCVQADCSTDETCATLTGGNEKIKCVNGKCVNSLQCNNLDATDYNNLTCRPQSTTGNCLPQNASSYLSKCNGKNNCNVTLTNEFFGPYPCHIAPPDSCDPNNPPVDGYCSLPWIESQGKYSQGYYVHGVYTCVPD
jgi:hypothetical protein